MRRFECTYIMMVAGITLALTVGGGRMANAQLTGSGPQTGIPNVSIPNTGGGGTGGSSGTNQGDGNTGQKTKQDQEAKQKAEHDKLAAEAETKKRKETATKKAAEEKIKAAAAAKEAARKAQARAAAGAAAKKKAAEDKAKVEAAAKLAADKAKAAADIAIKKAVEEKTKAAESTKVRVPVPSVPAITAGGSVRPTTRTAPEPVKVREPAPTIETARVREPAPATETPKVRQPSPAVEQTRIRETAATAEQRPKATPEVTRPEAARPEVTRPEATRPETTRPEATTRPEIAARPESATRPEVATRPEAAVQRPTATQDQKRAVASDQRPTVATEQRPTVTTDQRPTVATDRRTTITADTSRVRDITATARGPEPEKETKERRLEDLPRIDPEKYRTIQVSERRQPLPGTGRDIGGVAPATGGKDMWRQATVVADATRKEVPLTSPNGRSTESADGKELCRQREYFKAHLEECKVKIAKADSDRKDTSSLRTARESRCTRDNTVLQSKSAIFDIAKAKVMEFPETGATSKTERPLIVESRDVAWKQYILIPIKEKKHLSVMAVDPIRGVVRIFKMDPYEEIYVLENVNGVADILVLADADGLKFVTNAFLMVSERMKDATPAEQWHSLPDADLIDLGSVELKAIALPSGGQVLAVYPHDKSLVIVRGNANEKTPQDIVFLKSIVDTSAKSIPLGNVKGLAFRTALLGPNGNHLEMALVTTNNEKNTVTIFHTGDLLADKVTFDKTEMKEQEDGKLKSIEGKNKVKKSSTSTKTKVADKDRFEKMLSDAIAANTFAAVAVTHPFEGFGTSSNAIVFKDGAFGVVKLGASGLEEKMGELIVPQKDGEKCATSGEVIAVDIDDVGGKDIAVMIENNNSVSLIFYPNINQPQKFESVTAEPKAEGIQLHQKSVTEENEVLKCHWDAYQKMSDGTLKDVTSQLDNPDSCDPIFKTEATAPTPTAPAPKAPANQTSFLGRVADFLVAQLSISTAYAADTATTSGNTEYIFRVTTSDPAGLQATAEVTAQVAAPVTKSVSAALPQIKIMDVDILTPTQTEAIATTAEKATDGATPTPTTQPDVGIVAKTEGLTAQTIPGAEILALPEGGVAPGEGAHMFAAQGGCSLAEKTMPPSPMGWLWLLPLLAFIPSRVIYYQRSPRRPSRCQSARVPRH